MPVQSIVVYIGSFDRCAKLSVTCLQTDYGDVSPTVAILWRTQISTKVLSSQYFVDSNKISEVAC